MCGCGWKPASQRGVVVNNESLGDLRRQEEDHTKSVNDWLSYQGIPVDMPRKQRGECIRDLAREIGRKVKTPSTDWAKKHIEDMGDGVILLLCQKRLAMAALGMADVVGE